VVDGTKEAFLAGILFDPGERADTFEADQVIKVIFSREARR
jgi:hypothetical protein